MSVSKRWRSTTQPDFNGKWVNELNSTMDIVVDGSTLAGTYTSDVSEDGRPTEPHSLMGCINGALISFIVKWNEFDAITAWVGHMIADDQGTERIYTLWQMTKSTADPEALLEIWESVLSGSDTFRRIA